MAQWQLFLLRLGSVEAARQPDQLHYHFVENMHSTSTDDALLVRTTAANCSKVQTKCMHFESTWFSFCMNFVTTLCEVEYKVDKKLVQSSDTFHSYFVSTLCQLCINFVATLYQLFSTVEYKADTKFKQFRYQINTTRASLVSTSYQHCVNFVSSLWPHWLVAEVSHESELSGTEREGMTSWLVLECEELVCYEWVTGSKPFLWDCFIVSKCLFSYGEHRLWDVAY